ncbi:unnamed protein product [Leuciscus chuanchicus]
MATPTASSVQEQYNDVHSRVQLKDILKDVWDGENITANLHHADESALGLVLYQDAFEVANPLGSGKKKHKILAMYLTLADLFPHNRSSTDQMQLVFLCREQDFKYFGQELVMRCLVNDLKDLETTGVDFPDGLNVKGILQAIAGDNLGSHGIGGFLENFSGSRYFCRYCEIDKFTFQENPLSRARFRTAESYKHHVENLDKGLAHSGGIKFDSLFNELSFYHVSQPGLPPCLGHDLFEGVVSYDLALCIQHLVKVDRQFTYLELNRRISQFKFLGNDNCDRPCEINPGSEKLSGHAVQNWCFLRMLPMLIGDKIESPGVNEVWQLILLLREIVALVCAPAIYSGQIGYLRVLIDEYLHFRKHIFPTYSLRPKHHYLSHYPELIIHFGPLIRLWTLRFESKHMYFKQCVRKLHNFKNLCFTLSERHQLLQAFLRAGELFPPAIVAEKATEFVFFIILLSQFRAMSALVEELREIILRALPSNDENTTQLLIDKLVGSGLESKDDLQFVQQEDIKSETVTLDLTSMQYTPSLSAGSSSPQPCSSMLVTTDGESSSLEDSRPSTSHFRKSWSNTFQVPWQLMPAEIQSALSSGKRPSPPARRQMVRVLADEMRKFEPTPTRAQCLTICKAIVHQYPQSFADQLHDGRVVGEGYSSLLAQIKNRIDNLSRTTSFRQHRSAGSGVKRGPTDTYGCTRFQPDLPLDETDVSIETKRQKLEDLYSQEGAKGAEKAEVEKLMETTFCLQRSQINSVPAPSVAELMEKWPYLFFQKGLFAHFELLTDINVLRALELSMEDKPTNSEVKSILSKDEPIDSSYQIVQLLMAHFMEKQDELILQENMCATPADLEKTGNLPVSPRLILLVDTPEDYDDVIINGQNAPDVTEGDQEEYDDVKNSNEDERNLLDYDDVEEESNKEGGAI